MKISKYILVTFCGLVSIFFSTIAFADKDFSTCDITLRQDIDIGSLNKIQRLAVLSQASKSDFDNKKQKVTAGASFIYNGIPIDANGDWDQFEKKKNEETSHYKLDINNEEAWTWTKYTTNSQAYPAYQTCIYGILNQPGVSVSMNTKSMSQTEYPVTVDIRVDGEDRMPRKAFIQVTNGNMSNIKHFVPGTNPKEVDGGWIIKNIVGSKAIKFIATRTNVNKPVFIRVSVDKFAENGSAELIIPKIPILKEKKVTQSDTFKNSVTVEKSAGQPINGSLCVPSDDDQRKMVDDWIFSDGPALPPPVVANGSKGAAAFAGVIKKPKRICVDLGGYADSGEHSYNMVATFTMSAPADKWEWKVVDQIDLK